MSKTSSNPIPIEQIRRLRERTGAGVIECKKALVEAGGDQEQAIQILREKGKTIAAQKAGRSAHQGIIGSYVHGGRIGVLVEVNCETDFVAKTDPFKSFVQEICLQVASMNPRYISREEIPPELISPSGRQHPMETFYRERVLLDQLYVRDTSKTVQDLLTDTIAALRENIVIRRFIRFVLGEDV